MRPWLASVVLVTLAFSLPAFAELGGFVDSVQVDQAKMKATVKITQAKAYAVHEIKAPTGTVVREFVSPDGRVFGVAWQGPKVPDLTHLLGAYFPLYQAALPAPMLRRAPVLVHTAELVVEMFGHMRAISGRAYLPNLVPRTMAPEVIQ